jgi:aldehyde:ferredoxin oxidoreductase
MLSAMTGRTMSADDVGELGMGVLKTERAFNEKVGFTKADDRLPAFFQNEKLAPHDAVFDITDEEMDEFYSF